MQIYHPNIIYAKHTDIIVQMLRVRLWTNGCCNYHTSCFLFNPLWTNRWCYYQTNCSIFNPLADVIIIPIVLYVPKKLYFFFKMNKSYYNCLCKNTWPLIWQTWIIIPHLKLWLASARQNFSDQTVNSAIGEAVLRLAAESATNVVLHFKFLTLKVLLVSIAVLSIYVCHSKNKMWSRNQQ